MRPFSPSWPEEAGPAMLQNAWNPYTHEVPDFNKRKSQERDGQRPIARVHYGGAPVDAISTFLNEVQDAFSWVLNGLPLVKGFRSVGGLRASGVSPSRKVSGWGTQASRFWRLEFSVAGLERDLGDLCGNQSPSVSLVPVRVEN